MSHNDIINDIKFIVVKDISAPLKALKNNAKKKVFRLIIKVRLLSFNYWS